jgi:hypothetical protein
VTATSWSFLRVLEVGKAVAVVGAGECTVVPAGRGDGDAIGDVDILLQPIIQKATGDDDLMLLVAEVFGSCSPMTVT